jgi:hypothetical protein
MEVGDFTTFHFAVDKADGMRSGGWYSMEKEYVREDAVLKAF